MSRANCDHTEIVLIETNESRLRCRRCHLTIKVEDLEGRHCPECYERDGSRRDDFEKTHGQQSSKARYRCAQCQAIIEAG